MYAHRWKTKTTTMTKESVTTTVGWWSWSWGGGGGYYQVLKKRATPPCAQHRVFHFYYSQIALNLISRVIIWAQQLLFQFVEKVIWNIFAAWNSNLTLKRLKASSFGCLFAFVGRHMYLYLHNCHIPRMFSVQVKSTSCPCRYVVGYEIPRRARMILLLLIEFELAAWSGSGWHAM